MSSVFLEELWPDSASATYPSPACVGSTQGKDWHYCDGTSTVWYNGCCRRRNSTCNNGKGYICSAGGFKNKQGKCCSFPPGKARGPPASVNKSQDKNKPTYNPATKCQNCTPCPPGDVICGAGKWWCDINKQSCEAQAVAGQQAGQVGAALDPLAKYMPVFLIMGAGIAGIFLIQKIL